MKFKYKAKKGLEEIVEGVIEARSKDEALSILTDKGIFPLEIEESLPLVSSTRPKRKKLRKKDILFLIQKLATLCRAKVDMLTSLKVLHSQVESQDLRAIILEIYNTIKEGNTFSGSLEKFPQLFSPLIINVIKSGEASGHLDLALGHINEFLTREDKLKSKIIVSLAYPSFLLVVGIVSVIVLMNFVVPRIGKMFIDLNMELPMLTKIVLGISRGLQNWIVVIAGLVIVFIIISFGKKRGFNKAIRNLKLHLPVIKNLVKNQEMVSFTQSLSLLLHSGVPTLNSLEIASTVVQNPRLREELEKVCSKVALGDTISGSMDALTTLPKFFVNMIALGEEAGRLVEILDEGADAYTQEIDKNVGLVTSLLEPVLILV